MGLGGKISTGLFFVIVMLCGIGYWYYNNSQDTIRILNQNNSKLETAVKTNEQTITTLNENHDRAMREIQSLNDDLASTRQRNRYLVEKLQEHDLGFLANEKPELVERTINNATEKAGRCFEILSGAPLTEKELSAENGQQFNSECPWLWRNIP